MQAAAFLARFGLTVDQAAEFILTRVNDPANLFTILRGAGVGTDMVAQILQPRLPGLVGAQVRDFFAAHQLDGAELDAAYFDGLRNSIAPVISGMTHDNLTGTAGADHINGGAGNDTISGLDGDDILIGDSGNDSLLGGWGADFLDGGDGADRLEAGELRFRTQGGHWINDLSSNVLMGGDGADTLIGGHGPDRLDGGSGNDRLDGRAGNDTLIGGDGNDQIEGRTGNDVVTGGSGDDYLEGGEGADSIVGGTGNDTIVSAIQSDTHPHFETDSQNDTIQAGDGDDRIRVQHNDDVDAGAGNDRIEITYVTQADRRGVVVAGEGEDTIELRNMFASHGVLVDFTENIQMSDTIAEWNFSANHGLISPVLSVRGFNPLNDFFAIGGFNTAFGERVPDAVREQVLRQLANHSQILTDPSQAFLPRAANPANPDQHGKGFFVIQGAAASADDTTTVAAFLDPYGNNHTYGNGLRHYFFINVGATDSALYLFRDDTGANNRIVSDELTPIARFVGLRTENFTTADLLNVFI